MTDIHNVPGEDDATRDEENTDLDELDADGAGATLGEKDTFEPEESEGAQE